MAHNAHITRPEHNSFNIPPDQDLDAIITQIKTEFYRDSHQTTSIDEHAASASLNDHIKEIRDYMASWKAESAEGALEGRELHPAVGRQIKTASSSIYVKGYYRKNGKYIRPHLRARATKQKKFAVS